jgi:hypothetical protein
MYSFPSRQQAAVVHVDDLVMKSAVSTLVNTGEEH